MTRRRIIMVSADGTALTGEYSGGVLGDVHEGWPKPDQSKVETILVVPGHEVITHLIDLPPGSEAKAHAALPFLLEEDVASPLDDAHFALGPPSTGTRLAAVVSRAAMSGWIAQLAEHGLNDARIVPDHAGLPAYADRAIVIYSGASILAALPDGRTFAVDSAMAGPVLAAAFADHRLSINVYGRSQHLAEIRRLLPNAEVAPLPELQPRDLLGLVSQKIDSGAALNLRQGAFAVRWRWTPMLRNWRRAAAMALIFAGLAVAQQAVAAWRFGAGADAALAMAERIARETLPPSTRLVNARAQMKAYVDSLRGGSSEEFLMLGNALAESLTATGSGSLEALRYERTERRLASTVAVPSYDALAKLKAVLAARGATMTEGEARQTGAALVSDITVSLP
jgi:general secretion pathway protein L